MEMLKGKKTYIIAAALLVVVAVEKLMGFDVPGVEIGDNWLDYVFTALGLGALRNGMK